jgi:hypothetical protein
MRVSDDHLHELETKGFTVVPGFLEPDVLKAAQDALWGLYPRPEDYFADPSAYPRYSRSQFHGLELFPYPEWALNRLSVHPDLVDAAERFLSTKELHLYKIELWAKYSGAINYDQAHHRDFSNHTLVVPSEDGRHRQLTTFILLSDVTEVDGPTKLIPLEKGRDIPLWPSELPFGTLHDREEAAVGPAGSLMMYRTDVLHRGSDFSLPGRSRFAMLVDFQERGWAFTGKMAWPDRAPRKGWVESMEKMNVRERDLFGFPAPGHPYWTAQTLRDTGLRYPGMDMAPYKVGVV